MMSFSPEEREAKGVNVHGLPEFGVFPPISGDLGVLGVTALGVDD